ncbi:MAG: SGNH/GDSL hydrolase family protein [Alphaproteobacteria bacterium]|nr:SGNH/GDSL hydrolase family protein [Alphaproteobacteria bacterium]
MTQGPDVHAPARIEKSVHLIPRDAAVKRLCFDETSRMLRPNLVLVDRDGAVLFEINELGLKGASRDPSRKLAIVWGDSVVFGIGWSWPQQIDHLAPGYQFLNGGIEADPYDNILRRAVSFNEQHAVALNVVMLGWHPIPQPPQSAPPRRGLAQLYTILRRRPSLRPDGPIEDPTERDARNRRFHDTLMKALDHIPKVVLATMPTALNPRIVDTDLSSCFRGGGREVAFTFAGDVVYSVARQRFMFDYIMQRNEVVRQVALAKGITLIDLAVAFDTEHKADFRDDFHDMLHLRPSAYQKTAAIVHRGIAALLRT